MDTDLVLWITITYGHEIHPYLRESRTRGFGYRVERVNMGWDDLLKFSFTCSSYHLNQNSDMP